MAHEKSSMDLNGPASGTTATISYTGGTTTLFPGATLTSDGSGKNGKYYDQIQVKITSPLSTESLGLNTAAATFAAGLGVTVSYDASTGTLTLSKLNLSDANWQTLLRGITYTNSAPITGTSIRSLDVIATDPSANKSASSSTATIDISCFMADTMIATPRGERAVETLAIGDIILTHDGREVPIRWIGRSTVSMLFADKLRACPIRVNAGALGESVPVRDLRISPDHALLVEGVLVQAGALVNGTTIVRDTDAPSSFIYYHIELADHALILADGAPAETFIDNVGRMAFDNWEEHEQLYGSAPAIAEMDIPRAKARRQVPSMVGERIAKRSAEIAGKLSAAA